MSERYTSGYDQMNVNRKAALGAVLLAVSVVGGVHFGGKAFEDLDTMHIKAINDPQPANVGELSSQRDEFRRQEQYAMAATLGTGMLLASGLILLAPWCRKKDEE